MKTKKDKILLVRVTEKESEIVKELRQKFSINISNLIRDFINGYYEKTKGVK